MRTSTNKIFLNRFFLLCLLSVVIVSGCGEKTSDESAPVIRPVKTVVVGGELSETYSFPGTVEAGEKVLMSFRVPGRIIEIPVKEGENVEKGALIARLDPKDYELAVEEANALYTQTEADFKRYQTLYEKDAVPIAEFDRRRAQRDMARAKLESARKNLNYTRLDAPFSGLVGKRYVENFMDVQAQHEIVSLIDASTVEFIINIPETLIKNYERSAEAKAFAQFEEVPDKEFPLSLKEISTRAETDTQTFKVTFTMPQPKGITLLPGMTATVKILLKASQKEGAGKKMDLTIPAIAVIGDDDGSSYVWLVNEKQMTVSKRKVKVGELSGSENITVPEGLNSGDRVVTAGVSELQEGMKVRLWDQQ